MALINCPECGRQISDRAPSCPGCGILKEDIQAILAEQNASHSSMEEKKKSNNNDVLGPQGTEEEFVCYPTISTISESERTQYSGQHGMKNQNVEIIGKIGLEKKCKINTLKVGETIGLGTYAKKPIEWIVIYIYRNRALLLSKYILGFRSYHGNKQDTTWEKCDLREYLNHVFLNKFSMNERKRIMTISNENEDNKKYKSFGGEKTTDLVFCLSIKEVRDYLISEKMNIGAKLTEYAVTQAKRDGLQNFPREESGEAEWWLRSPGKNNRSATIVAPNELIEKKKLFRTEYEKAPSRIDECGMDVIEVAGIRPALWLRLEK